MKKIAIGILGTSDIIPRSIIEPAKTVKNVNIFGIASRTIEKAQKFSQIHGIPNIFPNYDSLLQCDEIDAVYIPLINSLHFEWIIKAAEAQKHILVEKPICLNVNEFEEIEKTVAKNKIHLLEGLMIQHHPWQKKIKEIVESKIYGRLKSIKTYSAFILEDKNNFRLDPTKGGGVFWDEGIYWCQLIQLCLGLNPISLSGKSAFNGPNGVDTTFEARLDFPGGVFSELFCSYELPYKAVHRFEFEKADLRIRNFWRPMFGLKIKIDINKNDRINFPPRNYYHDQLFFFVQAIEGKENNIPLQESYERIKIMEEIYSSSKNKNG